MPFLCAWYSIQHTPKKRKISDGVNDLFFNATVYRVIQSSKYNSKFKKRVCSGRAGNLLVLFNQPPYPPFIHPLSPTCRNWDFPTALQYCFSAIVVVVLISLSLSLYLQYYYDWLLFVCPFSCLPRHTALKCWIFVERGVHRRVCTKESLLYSKDR